jgi:hypothetical protein
MRKDGFALREFQGIRYYSCRALEEIPHVRHGFSTRIGEASAAAGRSVGLNLGHTSWDSIPRVDENRRRFLSALNLESSRLATLHQVHSNRVHIINDNSGEWKQPDADALATRANNIALAVQVADCLPILIADPVSGAVAAVHSGWRGTLSRVLFQTILALKSSLGSRPSDLVAAVGPGIRQCCMEVGAEVAELFEKEYSDSRVVAPASGGKALLDLCRALEIQMDRAGIPAGNRHDLGACTRCNPREFFSYRAEGPASGRMIAIIGRTKDE